MIIAYLMTAPDGDGDFFASAPNSTFCSECGSATDQNYFPTDLRLSRTSFEVSSTYDNRLIVSRRFKEFCEAHAIDGVDLKLVNKSKQLYYLQSDRKVQFDSARSGTRFLDRCQSCEQYQSVVGLTPPFLTGAHQSLDSGFYHTDLHFGSGREKAAAVIVGPETKQLIEAASFKRPEFIAVMQ